MGTVKGVIMKLGANIGMLTVDYPAMHWVAYIIGSPNQNSQPQAANKKFSAQE